MNKKTRKKKKKGLLFNSEKMKQTFQRDHQQTQSYSPAGPEMELHEESVPLLKSKVCFGIKICNSPKCLNKNQGKGC